MELFKFFTIAIALILSVYVLGFAALVAAIPAALVFMLIDKIRG